MGACASRPHGAADGEPATAAYTNERGTKSGNPTAAAPQARGSRRCSDTTGLSTADKIATAFIAQSAAVKAQSGKALLASPVSRRQFADTSPLGPAPAAESLADHRLAANDAAAAAVLDYDPTRPAEPSDESFERARLDTCRHLMQMQRGCRSSTATATAWPAAPRAAPTIPPTDGQPVNISEDSYDVLDKGGRNSRVQGSGGPDTGGGAGRGSVQSLETPSPMEADVVPVGRDVGPARGSVDGPAAGASWRDGGNGSGGEGAEGQPQAAASSILGLLPGEPEDDMASGGLPGSLLGPGADGDRPSPVGGRAMARNGHRFSDMTYLQQQMEPATPPLPQQQQAAPRSGAAPRSTVQPARNSDMGFYFEEARLTGQARGVAPVRHSLLNTPLARDLEARAAGGSVHKPTTLDYVPKLKAQPSRGNVLVPSQPTSISERPGGEDNAVPASRLEYVPSRAVSRKWTMASPQVAPSAAPAQLLSPDSVGRGLSSSVPSSASTLHSGGSGLGTDLGGAASRKNLHVSRFGAQAGAQAGAVGSGGGTPALSPRVSKLGFDTRVAGASAFSSQQLFEPLQPAESVQPAARPYPASVDVSQRPGVAASGPALHSPLHQRPSAPLLGGAGPPAASATATVASRDSLRSVAWTDIDPRHAAGSLGGASAGGGATADRVAMGTGLGQAAGGSRIGDRTSRLMASLHRLGVAPPDMPTPVAAASGAAVA